MVYRTCWYHSLIDKQTCNKYAKIDIWHAYVYIYIIYIYVVYIYIDNAHMVLKSYNHKQWWALNFWNGICLKWWWGFGCVFNFSSQVSTKTHGFSLLPFLGDEGTHQQQPVDRHPCDSSSRWWASKNYQSQKATHLPVFWGAKHVQFRRCKKRTEVIHNPKLLNTIGSPFASLHGHGTETGAETGVETTIQEMP